MTRQRSWWGWGWSAEALSDAECRALAERSLRPWLAVDGHVTPVPDEPVFEPPRVIPPSLLIETFAQDPRTRAAHAYGRSFRDVVRALHGRFDTPPDLVAFPRTVHDIVATLDWAEAARAVVVPHGGGTSVVGGVEYRGDRPWIALSLRRLSGVVEVDEVSRAVRVRAGTLGPDLEAALKPYGLTLRHYPQSFEFSTVGGWLATRAGGHYATGPTHIDDHVEALRVVTPVGPVETLRVPASGAGPSPDRLFLGSEGALGIITEAWLRVVPRPGHTASATMAFGSFDAGVAATRAVAQSGLRPSNCRLLDPLEAMFQAGVRDGSARLLLGFESADGPVDAALARTVEICADHGGAQVEGSAGAWREAFFRAPYLRDALIRLGLVVETVETAVTWSRFAELHAAVLEAVRESVPGGVAITMCRFTHVYPDGPAPYYTIIAPGRRGAEVAIWDTVKSAVSDAIAAAGGTITHHHAVGRDHRPWYDEQRSPAFAAALAAAKRALDPEGILNPGVIV